VGRDENDVALGEEPVGVREVIDLVGGEANVLDLELALDAAGVVPVVLAQAFVVVLLADLESGRRTAGRSGRLRGSGPRGQSDQRTNGAGECEDGSKHEPSGE